MPLALKSASMSHRLRFVVQAAFVSALFTLAGCVGDLVELTPRDFAGGGGGDMAMPPSGDMAGGGSVSFATSINPDIVTGGFNCTSASCHGGVQVPTLKDGAGEVMNNYTQAKTRATNGATSLWLTKMLPVAEGGVTHLGGNAYFPNKTDAKYLKWLSWVTGGQAP
jgi:hypothetical protein